MPAPHFHPPFSLTEEHVNSVVPVTGPTRVQHIVHEETAWKSLPIPSSKYAHEDIDNAAALLSAIAFSDFTIPIPPSHNRPSPQRKSTRQRRLHHSTYIAPGTRIAAVHENSDNHWFLAKVIQNDGGEYIVRDEDEDERYTQNYHVPRSCIKVLSPGSQMFDPGERVHAVYPDTTTFYPATVLQKKGRKWLVRFDDDDNDEADIEGFDGRLVDQSLMFRE